jgi:hypothetical protein
MLISSWLKSFRNRLHSQPRRNDRRKTDRTSRSAENLEVRSLLAAPTLVAVKPNVGEFVSAGDVLDTPPTELTLQFNPGQVIDPATVNSSTISLQRAGQDGTFGDGNEVPITIGFVGVGTSPEEVVVRFAENLPDDHYRITIDGSSSAPLANQGGEAFNDGVDQDFDFSLELGARIVAVDPQPVLRDREISVDDAASVADGDLIEVTVNGVVSVFEIEDTSVGNGIDSASDFAVNIDLSAFPTADQIATAIAGSIDGAGLGVSAVATANSVNVSGDSFEPAIALTLTTGSAVSVSEGAIVQRRDQIIVYLNDDDLDPASAANVNFYQLIFTNDTVSNLDDVHHIPTSAVYDAVSDTVVLTFASDIDLLDNGVGVPTAGTYRLRIGTSEARPNAPTETNVGADPGSSFATADNTLGTFATSGNTSNIIRSTIDPQLFPFEFPGANDEPGHREIELETHLNGGADGGAGISKISYNFQNVYGTDPLGNPLQNVITEAQKQRAREVFEFYSTLLGIDFTETDSGGLTIVTGDLRALDPTIPTGPGGVAGLAGGGMAIMDQAEVWSDLPGESWFQVAMHEIGHLLGLGHTYELPEVTVQGANGGATRGSTEPDFPGDHDIVHGQHLHRPDSIDIDMYRFEVPANTSGLFTAEVMAERLADSSQLDSYLRLYRENADGSRTLIAQNDDYFSEDSYLEVSLTEGTYYIGVSSTGNEDYDPTIEDTGIGGTSEGGYDLRVNFRPNIANPSDALVDEDDTLFDGDGDGQAGGLYNFWFRAVGAADTLFVDKLAISNLTQTINSTVSQIQVDEVGTFSVGDVLLIGNEQVEIQSINTTTNTLAVIRGFNATTPAAHLAGTVVKSASADGSAANPFGLIKDAFQAAAPGQIVRIVGNGGADGDIGTVADNRSYQIGKASGGADLEDGSTMNVPQGVTVMIDAGAIIKLRQARIGVGSSTTGIDRSGAALQVIGTPGNEVIFTSISDETIGTDTTVTPTSAAPGQWGGISFRNDIDRSEGRFNYQSEAIFLNYVNHADLRNGGGNVVVDSVLQTINPIHVTQAQPTISYNSITNSADSAMSADPDSFEEVTFHSPRFQDGIPAFTSGYTRVGPDIGWNTLTENSTNGLFVRVVTVAGGPAAKLTVPGRLDDRDIVHLIAQNLEIQGTPGGARLEQTAPDTTLVTLTPVDDANGSLTVGTYNYRVVFTDINGFESPASAVTVSAVVNPGGAPASDAILLNNLPPAEGVYVGRRLYRSTAGAGGPYTLVAELDSSDTSYLDIGGDLNRVLAPVAQRDRARLDARLSVDPGVVVKLDNARIEVEIGAQFLAEGLEGQEVIFTSRFDDRYGAGGTFDTNDDDLAPTEATPSAGDWGGIYIGHLGSASIDHALVTFAGGVTPNQGDFSGFNALEIHQAEARVTNSVFENNGNGRTGDTGPGGRFGLFPNGAATIFVRGSQPVIMNNEFRDNNSQIISINANSLNSESVTDYGRSVGRIDQVLEYPDNQGPLVRDNRLGGNAINAMHVRGETLTTEVVFDDTDIVHAIFDEIYVPDLHTFGGLRLESSATESLVVKLQGANAGISASGYPLDIIDRIGGSVQIIGQPGQPVVLTSLADDTVGAGFDLNGLPLRDTNNNGVSSGSPGDWRSISIEEYAHDRNVAVHIEREKASAISADTNSIIQQAEVLGLLASEEKASDENLRLGFEIHGVIDSPDDEDIYSFTGTAGTQVWLDIDRTNNSLDSVVELLDADGNIIAISDNINDALSLDPTGAPASTLAYSPFLSDDYYTLNALDAGLRVVLPGATGTTQSYFVRVRSSNADPLNTIGGLTSGLYQLQVRIQELDEFPGSQVTYADIRFANRGIEVYGQPAHSPLSGESTEINNAAGVTSVTVGNLMNSDRAALSLAGRLASPVGNTYDIDLWEFEVAYDATQTIAGVSNDAPHVPVTIDLDFADGFARADATIAVFDANNQLILIGRDSNIADDQPKPNDGADVDDLSRGSNGKLDPFIGPVELIAGTYRLAVFPTVQTPQVLDQYFEANPTSSLIRLEPINSVERVAEERFGPSTIIFDPFSGTFVTINSDTQSTAGAPITDLFTIDAGGDIDPSHVVPFNLNDVTLFVSQAGGTKGNDESTVVTVDPFTGTVETTLGSFGPSTGDIAMRADGQLHSFSTGPQGTGNETDGNTGNYLLIDTGTAAATVIGDDGIATMLLDNGNAAAHNVGIQFNAMAYTGTTGSTLYAVGDRSTAFPRPGQNGAVVAPFTTNILYNFVTSSGAVDGVGNNRTDAAQATQGAGTTQREVGQVDTSFGNGGLDGQVTGMVSLNGFLYVVDDEGGLYRVNSSNAATTFINEVGADPATGVGGLGLDFQGLALGPENVENGLYADTLFGITSTGELYAFDDQGVLQPIFVDAQTFIDTGLNSVTGLDFGTLDYNLWHITTNRGGNGAADDGHGIDVAPFDNSVALPDPGGASLHFGFEHGGNTPDPSLITRESGNKNTDGNNAPSTALNRTLDFPGGAHGSVVSNEFSLEGYHAGDKPTLYFNYFLDTEDANYNPGTNPADLMRDALRVFVSDESGQWNLLSTNDSFQDAAQGDEFDYGPDGGTTQQPVTQTFPDVVETFDNSNWRQVRIDLSNYAGRAGLQLRFDFSTAGSMALGEFIGGGTTGGDVTGSELYAVDGSEITDGDGFTLEDYDNDGNLIGTTTFEFDLGAHMIVPSGNALDGESFTVFGETFTFAFAPAGPNDILVLPQDTAEVAAQRATDFLNAFFDGTRVTAPAGDVLEGESFSILGTTFTYTATPFLSTDILAEPGDTPDTIAYRTVQIVNAELGAGTAVVDGSSIDFPGVTNITFGGSLNVGNPFALEGESFTVLGTTFTFTNTPLISTDIQIQGTAAATATEAANVINAELGAGTAFASAQRLSVADLPTVADAFFTGGTLVLADVVATDTFQMESFTVFGTTFTFVDVPTQPNDIQAQVGDTAGDLANRVVLALNAAFGAGTAFVDPGAPGRVSIPNIPSPAASLTRGGTLVLQNIGALQGYEFNVLNRIFRFTNNPQAAGDILTRPADSPLLIAQRTVAEINLRLGAGTAVRVNDRVSIANLPLATSGFFLGGQLDFSASTEANLEGDSFTVFGTTFTFAQEPRTTLPANAVDIDVTGLATPAAIAGQVATEINTALGIARATANGNVVDIAGAINGSFGGSFSIIGPDAAALNGDQIQVNGVTFTFVDNNPTGNQIDTDNNLNTVADRTVTAINNVFGANASYWDIDPATSAPRITVRNTGQIVFVTDSGSNGSIVVDDDVTMTYSAVSDPLGNPLFSDINDSPMQVDGVGTPLTHDVADTPITLSATPFITAQVNQNRITIQSAPSITTPGSALVVNAGEGAGVAPGAVAIAVNSSMDRNEVAIAIRQAMADVYAGTVINGGGVTAGDINNIKGHEEMIRLIRHRVEAGSIDGATGKVGPLGHADFLPGDEFGAFDAGFVNGQATRPGSLRGMNNAIEGVYIDDIIIGFAERGEMVTNAPAGNANFTDNDDVLNPDVPAGNEFLGIVDGFYDVEIRRATDYGMSDSGTPSNLLYRTLNTNDREVQGIAISVPGADQIPDRSTIELTDGIRTVTLQFVDLAASASADPGNVPIFFDSRTATTGTYLDSQEAIGAALIAALNSQTVQNVVEIQATASGTSLAGGLTVHVIGNATMTPDAELTPLMPITVFNAYGDQNHHRDQGQVILHSNFVTDSADYGIYIDAAPRGGLNPTPHAGSVKNTQEINNSRQVPGVVVSNNVVADNVAGGIFLSGDTRTDPLGPVPFARIVNNTVVGIGSGDGIHVEQNAAPTLLNNIVTGFTRGINVDGSSAGGTVIGTTVYQSNGTNSNVGVGAFPIILQPADPLFVDAANGNYYPAPFSQIIDSSQTSQLDRTDLVRVKSPLGIALSPILAPELDVFGQLRGDDPDVATPAAQGSSVFVDRGAIDRVDFFQPDAVLTTPEDDSAIDLNPSPSIVWVNQPADLREFVVRLVDDGIGIDDANVNSSQFTLLLDGTPLVDGVDYLWSYNSTNDEVIFTAVTTFPFERQYQIQINNTDASVDGIDGVRDLAGNYIAANRGDNTTRFDILVTDGVNDPPINTVPLTASTDEDVPLVFSSANGNAISVSDADVHLGNNRLQVTLTATDGTLTLNGATSDVSGVLGLTFTAGDGWNDVTMTFEGDVADINAALEGLQFIPTQDYSNILPTDIPPSGTPATLTITTEDQGQFSGPPSPNQVDVDVINIDVVEVNDPPTFDPLTDPAAVDEDAGAQTVAGFVQNISPGPANESSQTVSFNVSVTGTTGNLAFTSAPAIDATGQLTYETAPDTNGTATVEVIAVDSDGASSAPVPFTLTVNAVNDEPEFTFNPAAFTPAASGIIQGVEDSGTVVIPDFMLGFAAGPATATDEIAAQTTTWVILSVVQDPGSTLTFDQLSVDNTTGALTYQPTANTSGRVTVSLALQDDGPTGGADDNLSATQTFVIDVTEQPDAPVAATGDYTIDEGDTLMLDASASTDADLGHPGDTLFYYWDLNNDGDFTDVQSISTDATISVPYSHLQSLGLTEPSVNPITLRVVDTYDGSTPSEVGATLTILIVDYGDAPDSYGTVKGSNGAAHTITGGLFLGSGVDNETDGTPTVAADGDDTNFNGDDEDGVVIDPLIQRDATQAVPFYVIVTASAAGKVDLWLDLNGDGTFDHGTEYFGDSGVSHDVVAGENRIELMMPAGAFGSVSSEDTYLRARFSSAGNLLPTGRADDGEVEDYRISINPVAAALQPTVTQPAGPETSDLTPTIAWTDEPENYYYDVVLTPLAGGPAQTLATGTIATSVVVPDALPDGSYSVVVTPYNKLMQVGPASAAYTFVVEKQVVTTIAGQTPGMTALQVGDNTPTITWNEIEGTQNYQLVINSLSTGVNGVVQEFALPGGSTSYTVPTPLNLGRYEVLVRAIDADNHAGDWSDPVEFHIVTAPTVLSPTGVITDSTPLLQWSAVPGALTYEIWLGNLTNRVVGEYPTIIQSGITGTSFQVPQTLTMGDYLFQVRAVSAPDINGSTLTGVYSPGGPIFTVAPPPTPLTPVGNLSNPVARVNDSTPTIGWEAVPGADEYVLEVRRDFGDNGPVIAPVTTTSTQFTITTPLPLGRYAYRIRAINRQTNSTSGDVTTAFSAETLFEVTTAPVIQMPNVSIYDTTPVISWTQPVGAVAHEVWINYDSGSVTRIVHQTNVTGNQLVIGPGNIDLNGDGTPDGDELPPGDYRVWVRSFADAARTIVSDWSAARPFRIGTAPVTQGPAAKTTDSTPTLTWEGSLGGETYDLWFSSISAGTTVFVETGLNSASYTIPSDLPIGKYRFWVRATSGFGEKSDWSAARDFEVTSPPVIQQFGASTFDTTPTFTWTDLNREFNGVSTDVFRYEIWINDVTGTSTLLLRDQNVLTNTYTVPSPLANGRYTVWVRAFASGSNAAAGTTVTAWSTPYTFDVGGRVVMNPIAPTTDPTPEISWRRVGDAASYEIFIARASTPNTAVIRQAGLTTNSYTPGFDLSSGNYLVWVRAVSTSGTIGSWSVPATMQINPLTAPVINTIGTTTDTTPTFSWAAVTGATRYRVYVERTASPNVPLIDVSNVVATSYTPTTGLAPDQYRLWVRAIAADGTVGPWSASLFTIVTADSDLRPDEPHSEVVLLASLDSAGQAVLGDDVTVSMLPSRIAGADVTVEEEADVPASPVRQSLAKLPEAEADVPAEQVQQLDETDALMSQWDSEVWAEESARPAEDEEAKAKAAGGWLAGVLAASAVRSNRQKKKNS